MPDALRDAAEALAEACPKDGWTRASHDGTAKKFLFKDSKAKVTLDMHIRQFPLSFDRKTGEPQRRYGWKQSGNVLFPRLASEIQAVNRFDSPMAFHWLTENALVNGASGFGRIGADFWPPYNCSNWYGLFERYLLCPGPDGAEASVRFEGLREGVQEAEVRIWLERSGKDQIEPAKSVLADRIRQIGTLGTGNVGMLNSYYAGWQERSWELYAAAVAAAGGKVPSAEEKITFFGPN